ncbi:MAG: hypothetical protein ACE5JM_17275, partial [Armatimonadota bacterium]
MLLARAESIDRLLFDEAPTSSIRLREGIDYRTPDEREALLARKGLERTARRVPRPGHPLARELVVRMLREILSFERFGRQFPDGLPWGRQPAWKIACYRAFFGGLVPAAT